MTCVLTWTELLAFLWLGLGRRLGRKFNIQNFDGIEGYGISVHYGNLKWNVNKTINSSTKTICWDCVFFRMSGQKQLFSSIPSKIKKAVRVKLTDDTYWMIVSFRTHVIAKFSSYICWKLNSSGISRHPCDCFLKYLAGKYGLEVKSTVSKSVTLNQYLILAKIHSWP